MSNVVSELPENSVTIHRVSLNSHFTITSNSMHEDPNLSFAAKGLLGYILSRPQNWEIKTWQLAKVYMGSKKGNGVDAIEVLMQELKEQGYLVYSKSQNTKGQWEHRYDAYPQRIKDFQKMFPEGDLPAVVLPAVENPAMVNPPISTSTELKRKDLTKNQSINQKSDDDFKFSKDDWDELKKKYTKDQMREAEKITFEKCHSTCGSAKKKYFLKVLESLKDYAPVGNSPNTQINRDAALEFKAINGWSDLRICEKHIELQGFTGKDISLNIDPSSFMFSLNNLYGSIYQKEAFCGQEPNY
jgi:hypothetical protein